MTKSTLRLLKRIFLILFTLIVLTIIVGVSLAYIYEAEVKQFAIEKINEQTNSKINVEKIELSFLKRFPMAALQFHNVEVMEAVETGGAGSLLKAGDIFLKFDVIDLIQNRIVLKDVEINDSKLNMLVFENGSDNFHVFKKQDTTESKYLLEYFTITINNSELWYHNYATKQKMDLLINKSSLSGDFIEKQLDVKLLGDVLIREYKSEGYKLFSDKELSLDFHVKINSKTKQFDIVKGDIAFNKIPFIVTGNLEKPEIGVLLNLKIKANSLSLTQIVSTIPQAYKSGFDDYSFNGLLSIDASVKGMIVARSTPSIKVYASLQNATIKSHSFDAKMQNINMTAFYSNGKRHALSSSLIQIKKLNFEMNDSKFSAVLKLSNFVKSKLVAEVNADLNLDELIKFTGKFYGIEKLSGTAKLKLKLAGKINGIVGGEEVDLQHLDYQIGVVMNGVNLKHRASKAYYKNIVGSLSINANDIHIDPTWVELNGHRQHLSGTVNNYRKWSAHPENQKLRIRGNVDASNISYADIEQIIDDGEPSSGIFPNSLDIILSFKADTFYWNNLLAQQASGTFSIRNQMLSIKNTRFQAFDGTVNAQFSINGSKANLKPFYCTGHVKSINITQVFNGFNDFNQKVITSENIKGNLQSNFTLNANFNKNWNVVSKSIALASDVVISNGELNNIKELDALSKYTRINDFSHISFSTIENTIQINEGVIMIPDMLVKSNKMNIDVAGTHDFDNNYDYHMGVLMSEVLFKKAKAKSKNEFGEVQSDGYGKTKLFFHVYGKGSDVHVKYDSKNLAKKLKSDMKEDGSELKSALNKEFGWFKKSQDEAKADSTDKVGKSEEEKEKENLKKQEEGEFIFEWDDEEGEEKSPEEK
jgi:hypothetical protein